MISTPYQHIRAAAVAGLFYPDDPDELKCLINLLLKQANTPHISRIKALIAPHAGYVYSGPIAASVYQSLKQQADEISRVVLLGPSHRVEFYGIASTSAQSYLTPLGEIPVDRSICDQLAKLPEVTELDNAHTSEHSLEVQLPFLQYILNDFSLVPLVVGDCPAQKTADILETIWGGDETLILISSDLSHYNAYHIAQTKDQKTSDAILNLKQERIHYEDACGRNPIKGLLIAAKQHDLKPHLLDLRNSGDTAGNKERVVGYGAYAFTQ